MKTMKNKLSRKTVKNKLLMMIEMVKHFKIIVYITWN